MDIEVGAVGFAHAMRYQLQGKYTDGLAAMSVVQRRLVIEAARLFERWFAQQAPRVDGSYCSNCSWEEGHAVQADVQCMACGQYFCLGECWIDHLHCTCEDV